MPDDEAALTADIVRLATRYGRYGYRRIREMLVAEGWRVNVKRVYRIWRREGLKVPMKQPKRGRLWLNDGSCVGVVTLSSFTAETQLLAYVRHSCFQCLSRSDEHENRPTFV